MHVKIDTVDSIDEEITIHVPMLGTHRLSISGNLLTEVKSSRNVGGVDYFKRRKSLAVATDITADVGDVRRNGVAVESDNNLDICERGSVSRRTVDSRCDTKSSLSNGMRTALKRIGNDSYSRLERDANMHDPNGMENVEIVCERPRSRRLIFARKEPPKAIISDETVEKVDDSDDSNDSGDEDNEEIENDLDEISDDDSEDDYLYFLECQDVITQYCTTSIVNTYCTM